MNRLHNPYAPATGGGRRISSTAAGTGDAVTTVSSSAGAAARAPAASRATRLPTAATSNRSNQRSDGNDGDDDSNDDLEIRKKIQYEICNVIFERDRQEGVRTSRDAIQALTELVYQILKQAMIPDIYTFGRHRTTTRITKGRKGDSNNSGPVFSLHPDDVLLLLRKVVTPSEMETLRQRFATGSARGSSLSLKTAGTNQRTKRKSDFTISATSTTKRRLTSSTTASNANENQDQPSSERHHSTSLDLGKSSDSDSSSNSSSIDDSINIHNHTAGDKATFDDRVAFRKEGNQNTKTSSYRTNQSKHRPMTKDSTCKPTALPTKNAINTFNLSSDSSSSLSDSDDDFLKSHLNQKDSMIKNDDKTTQSGRKSQTTKTAEAKPTMAKITTSELKKSVDLTSGNDLDSSSDAEQLSLKRQRQRQQRKKHRHTGAEEPKLKHKMSSTSYLKHQRSSADFETDNKHPKDDDEADSLDRGNNDSDNENDDVGILSWVENDRQQEGDSDEDYDFDYEKQKKKEYSCDSDDDDDGDNDDNNDDLKDDSDDEVRRDLSWSGRQPRSQIIEALAKLPPPGSCHNDDNGGSQDTESVIFSDNSIDADNYGTRQSIGGNNSNANPLDQSYKKRRILNDSDME